MKLIKALFYENGQFSTTRLWKHVAYALVTYIVWQMGKDATWEVLALYLAIIAADNRAGSIIKAKFQSEQSAQPSFYGRDYPRPYGSRRTEELEEELDRPPRRPNPSPPRDEP